MVIIEDAFYRGIKLVLAIIEKSNNFTNGSKNLLLTHIHVPTVLHVYLLIQEALHISMYYDYRLNIL